MSLTSEFTPFNVPGAFLKITFTFMMVSPAGTPKKERTLAGLFARSFKVYRYLLPPSAVAFD